MKKSSRKVRTSEILSLAALCSWFSTGGCGVDVGNAGKPLEPNNFAEVVGLQHDEALSAATVSLDELGDSMALRTPLADSPQGNTAECEPNADGSLNIKRVRNFTAEKNFGRSSGKKTQSEVMNQSFSLKITPDSGVASCNGKKPKIRWADTASYNSFSTVSKQRQRTVREQLSKQLLRELNLQSSSTREELVERKSFTAEQLVLHKTIRFSSELQQSTSASTRVQRRLETLADEPLRTEITLNRDGGRSIRIISGAVASATVGEKKLIIRYQNIELGSSTSCQPSSGSLEGQIFADTETSTAESSFALIFSVQGAVLKRSDGSEEDLELESCRIVNE